VRTGCLRYTPMRAEPVQVAGTISARRWPDIWRFVSSPVVQVGQYLLNHNGYTVNTDGAFTAATIAAVAGFQSEARSCGRPGCDLHRRHVGGARAGAGQDMQQLHGLEPDGKVDLSTWYALVGVSVKEAFGAMS